MPLQMQGISKSFGAQIAVNNVELIVSSGEVHGLIGQNGAGKSTVVNILAGRLRPDEGAVAHGERVLVSSDHVEHHLEQLVAVVHQEGSILPDLTIGENLVLGEVGRAFTTVSRRQLRTRVEAAYGALGLPAPNPALICARLPPADRKILEIVRAFSSGAGFVLLDEPTASLDPRLTDWLIATMREAAHNRSLGVIFVSHRLREIQRATDRVSILRDGAVAWAGPSADISAADMVRHIAGDEMAARVGMANHHHRGRLAETGAETAVLEVENLRSGTARDVAFSLQGGEILGIAGVEGQGQRDLLYAIAGVRRFRGQVKIGGRSATLRSRRSAMRAGIVFLADDRARQGVIAPMSISDNMIAASLGPLSLPLGLRSGNRERAFVHRSAERFSIKMATRRASMNELSGGNQQKVLLARALSRQGRVVILYEPTQGVDVGVKADIYAQLSELASEGLGILIYSSDEDELSMICDRVLVLGGGSVVAELTGEAVTRDAIVEAMVSYSEPVTQTIPPRASEEVLA